jgi:hypothetical protein
MHPIQGFTNLELALHIDLDIRLAILVNNVIGHQLGVTLYLLVSIPGMRFSAQQSKGQPRQRKMKLPTMQDQQPTCGQSNA